MTFEMPNSTKKIDFRTDSSSVPTDAMRRAVAEAKVGNDYYIEDPTVNQLESIAAHRLGKEAALFVTSGTMGNLLAILAYAQRGDEIIVGEKAHIANSEAGGASVWGGVAYHTVAEEEDGMPSLEAIDAAIRRPNDPLSAPTVLVTVENTHNVRGGQPLSAEQMRAIANVAHKHDLPVHVDGARIFHAEIALGTPVSQLVAEADSVTFCLSKGLGCPVGSVLCGNRSMIEKARKLRLALGGQMRQAGILAAAGVLALQPDNTAKLSEDHINAEYLARGLSQIPGILVESAPIRTNLVYAEITANNVGELARRLEERGIYGPEDSHRWRFVTYRDISSDDIDTALTVISEVFREYGDLFDPEISA